MGRSKYNQGEFEQAIKLLNQVSKDSQFYVHARFFEGVSYIRLRKAKPASAAFKDILDSIESGDVEGIEDEDRMRDLALISLARVFYTAANRVNEGGERKVDGKLLGGAVEAWNSIGPESEYWLDSLFEASWAFFLADEFSRALGNVHTLFSPYFTGSFYPEAMVLKAVVFFSNCQMENASAVVGQFHQKYDPVKKKLEEILQKYKDNAQFFEFLKQVREGRANLPPEIRGVVESALSDRTVLANLEYVALLEQQKKS